MIKFELKDLLKKHGITMSELSNRTGISKTALSQLATGKTQGIQFETLDKIATTLDISPRQISQLFSYSPNISSPDLAHIIPFEIGRNPDRKYFYLIFKQKLYQTTYISLRASYFEFDPSNSKIFYYDWRDHKEDAATIFQQSNSLKDLYKNENLSFTGFKYEPALNSEKDIEVKVRSAISAILKHANLDLSNYNDIFTERSIRPELLSDDAISHFKDKKSIDRYQEYLKEYHKADNIADHIHRNELLSGLERFSCFVTFSWKLLDSKSLEADKVSESIVIYNRTDDIIAQLKNSTIINL